jgi:hypothetical protein
MKFPDRLSTERKSPFFDRDALDRKPVVYINEEKHTDDVVEYCISGGWARVIQKDEAGNMLKNVLADGYRVKRVFGTIRVEFP